MVNMKKQESEKNKDTSVKSCNQWIATFGVFLLQVQCGIQVGWMSPNVARFRSEETPFPITKNETSWIVSISSIAGLIGILPVLMVFELIGSRRVVLLAFIGNSLTWICLIIANSVVWIYIARILVGLAAVAASSCYAIYLSKVVEPKIRGTLISIASSGNSVGVLIGIIAETYITSMKISSSIYLVTCVMAIILVLWLEDSPYYLVKKGDFEGAKRSIAFYFTGCDVEEQLLSVKAFVQASVHKNLKDRCKELKSPTTRKSIFIICVLCALPHVSGHGNLLSYMEVILKSAELDVIKPKEFAIYANIVSIVANALTVRVSDKFGRRAALMMSSIGTSIGMTCLGLHFYLLKEKVDVHSLQWLPIFSIIFFSLSYAIGYNTVPGIVLSELFLESIKSIAVCFAYFSASIFEFMSRQAFQPTIDTFGEEYMFWIYAGLTLLSIPFALSLLPETNGKTFEQIQNDLKKR